LSIIRLENLSKHFKVLNRREGLKGSFKDLFSRDYRLVKAVDGISIEIEKGQTVGFVGPNGAGKSTTIKMMTGVLEPTSGEILINDKIPFKDRKNYMKGIGVVFGQRTQLWWELPVIESFKLLKEIYRIDKKTYQENTSLFDELVNLKDLYSTPVRFLSLGQRMLCDIAAAFLHNPKVIFLDEPTIGLDVSIKSKIRDVIRGLNEKNQTTVILTTHDVSDIEALCKKIIIIDKGSIIFNGNIERVTKMFGAYRTLKMDFSSYKDNMLKTVDTKINEQFGKRSQIHVENLENNWIGITINQDEIKLLEVLTYLMGEYDLKDIKVEEIQTESIIKKIYEGELK